MHSLKSSQPTVFFFIAFLTFSFITGLAGAASSPVPERIQGFAGITQPYPYLNGGSYSGPAVSYSPDPLIQYRWSNPTASDGLQVYDLTPESVTTTSPASFGNLNSLTTNSPNVTVSGTGDIRVDFGVESAGWLEIESDDLSGDIELSISEYNEPAVVNTGPANRFKTKTPVKYGNVYRLELNSELYEGVRFGWIHVKTFSQPWHIKGVRLVCQVKPTNYTGSFSCSESTLDRVWYTGAYVVKLNLLEDYFGAILMDRGDRHSWTGDAHPAQAASLAAFGNFDFVKANLQRTADDSNRIESYSLYWIFSLIDYYMYTGDDALMGGYIANVENKLSHAATVYDSETNLRFFGWDERLGAGFESPNITKTRTAYRMLFIRACKRFAEAMDHYGRTDLRDYYNNLGDAKVTELRKNSRWYSSLGLHASADAVNAGFTNQSEQAAIFNNAFADPRHRLSYSPFNQYFVIQALAAMGKYDEAISSIKEYWGGQIAYGGTTFFEVFRPDWLDELGQNDPVPNNQCGYTSLAHPWGAGVTHWLTAEILGIKPTSPGFDTFDILPHPGSQLTRISGQVFTNHGTIEASFNLSSGECSATVPTGTTARIGIPKAGKTISRVTVNGGTVWNGSFQATAGIGGASEDRDFVYLENVPSGTFSIGVTYSGRTPTFSESPSAYAASFTGTDSLTGGNWSSVYGGDGYVLCNYNGSGSHVKAIPSYVQSVTFSKTNNLTWNTSTTDERALSPGSGNPVPRTAAAVITRDPLSTYQTMTMDVVLKPGSSGTPFQVALYLVDWDNNERVSAVEMFDYSSKKLISPLKLVSGYGNGKYFIYSYNQSCRFRINQVRGDNAVLSGVFFDAPGSGGLLQLSNNTLIFGGVSGGGVSGQREVTVTNAGSGSLSWNVSTSQSWITLSPVSGSAGERFYVSTDPSGLAPGTYTGSVIVSANGAANSPQAVDVSLTVYKKGSDAVPFGSFETPLQGATGVAGAIPVTGWVLDDVETAAVEIHFSSGNGAGMTYIDDAIFVSGARPDVEAGFPTYPFNHRAGWGYMLLTNYLPDSGNGVFTIYAVAVDTSGHSTILGGKTITCDNANSVKPFGTIDTPVQGGEVTGTAFKNFGWVLTPHPNAIPEDGSTLSVFVDGKYAGQPVYNLPRNDIAGFFPGYANTDGPVGYFMLDTTKYANGTYTIQWSAKDDAGNSDGIGSRFFTINNTQNRAARNRVSAIPPAIPENVRISMSPVKVKKGYDDLMEGETVYPGPDGVVTVQTRELQRVVIDLKGKEKTKDITYRGFLRSGNKRKHLPLGSTLDKEEGIFYWIPPLAYNGDYILEFYTINSQGIAKRQLVKVTILPKFSHRADGYLTTKNTKDTKF